MQLPLHARFPPRTRGVEVIWIEFHVGHQHTWCVQFEFTDDGTVGANREAGPAGRACRGVIRTDPDVVLRGSAGHRRGNNGLPDVIGVVIDRRLARIMERLKQNLYASLNVIAVQFGKAVLVTDRHTAGDPFEFERDG